MGVVGRDDSVTGCIFFHFPHSLAANFPPLVDTCVVVLEAMDVIPIGVLCADIRRCHSLSAGYPVDSVCREGPKVSGPLDETREKKKETTAPIDPERHGIGATSQPCYLFVGCWSLMMEMIG